MNRPDIAKEISSEITPELFATGFGRKIYEMFRDDFVSGNEVTISKNGELSPDEAGAVARMIAKRAKLTGNTVNEARALIAALKQEYPDSVCALHYKKDYELMIAVRLSAQCTDARVNLVTPALFTRYPTLEAFADADIAR